METTIYQQLAVSEIIASAGLLVQSVNAIFIFILLFFMRKTNSRRPYVKYWVYSWAFLVCSLLSISLYYFLPVSYISTNVRAAIDGFYLVFKLAHYFFLSIGLSYYFDKNGSYDLKHIKFSHVALVIGTFFIFQMVFRIQTNLMVIIQAPFAIFVFLRSAYLIKKYSASSSKGLAIEFTRNVLLAFGILWLAYFLLFPYSQKPSTSILPGNWDSFTAFNSYYDLVLQTLLAFGQVMLIMQHDHSDLSAAHKALKHQSLTDHLTGSYNRQALHEHNRKTDTLKKGASIVVCDLDNLKVINDQFGHDEGDHLLKHFVTQVEKQLRVSDSVYRWGGDEFVIVLSDSTRGDANNKMEEITKNMKPMTLSNGSNSPICFSYGISYCGQSDNIDDAISTADRRMYSHKESRRK